MILSVRTDHDVGSIRMGICNKLLRKDEALRWKEGMKIQFWIGRPDQKVGQNFHFASSVLEHIKYLVYCPNRDVLRLVESDGSWADIKGADRDKFVKECNYKDMHHFANKHKKYFESRLLCWSTKEEDLKIINIDRYYGQSI